MKALFFLYEGYVDWEISPLSCMLNVCDVEIDTAALNEEVTHEGKFKVKVDLNIEACNPSNYNILIIPGGEPAPFDKDERLLTLIRGFDKQGKWIAAMCGGPHSWRRLAFCAKESIQHNDRVSQSFWLTFFICEINDVP